MTKFCEGCPVRGNCTDSIESIEVISSVTHGNVSQNQRFASLSAERGVPQGPTDMTVRYKDTKGGGSNTIKVYGNSGPDAKNNAVDYLDIIELCSEPTEVKRFFGLVTRKVCCISSLPNGGNK